MAEAGINPQQWQALQKYLHSSFHMVSEYSCHEGGGGEEEMNSK